MVEDLTRIKSHAEQCLSASLNTEQPQSWTDIAHASF